MNETSRPDKPVMIYRKTAILQKNGIFAAVGVYSYLEFCYDAPGDGTAEEKALDLFERGLEIWNMRA